MPFPQKGHNLLVHPLDTSPDTSFSSHSGGKTPLCPSWPFLPREIHSYGSSLLAGSSYNLPLSFQWENFTRRTFLETLSYQLLSVSFCVHISLMPDIWMWHCVSIRGTVFSFFQVLRVAVYIALRIGLVRSETLRWLTCSSPHMFKSPTTLTRDPILYRHMEPWSWKDLGDVVLSFSSSASQRPWPSSRCLKGAQRQEGEGEPGRWGAANSASASNKAAIPLTLVDHQVLHFILSGNGVLLLKRDLNTPGLLCSLHLAEEKTEAQRSNFYSAC